MENDRLERLLAAYREAPREFQATRYWAAYEAEILSSLRSMDMGQLRSGKYPYLATLGFNDTAYFYHPSSSIAAKLALRLIHRFLFKDRRLFPYGMGISDIRELAYRHCQLLGEVTGARPIDSVEVSTFGNPGDLFEIGGKRFTMPFLNYYARYCFAHGHVSFAGRELVVELGSGSGYQVEVLKKLYPDLTVLCFDLPAQIYLGESYLANALGGEAVVGTDETLSWEDLSGLRQGRVHCFGNWQFPLVRELRPDLFWNAASFGEMEPDIVENYLGFIRDNARWIYLLQARHGKELSGKARVNAQTTFDDYVAMLPDFDLVEARDAWQANRRLSDSGGYFEAVWKAKPA